jgi:uracil-DNA glycosylase
MDRGRGRTVMIVGKEPGRTEVKKLRAFSGSSGKRLDRWLVTSGFPEKEPRSICYLTSVLKCPSPTGHFNEMRAHCRGFLDEQVDLIAPTLIITLGAEAYEYFRVGTGSFHQDVCKLFLISGSDLLLPPAFQALLHWPHPSGLNRWHNESANQQRLSQSFQDLRGFMEELA